MSGTRRIDLAGPDGADGPRLAGLLAAARLVCFPTDTVYGVGGLVTPAVRAAVIAAKGREAGKPLQVVYPSLELLEASLALAPRLLGAVRRLLPGPFTLLLPYPPGLAFPPAGEVPHRAQGVVGRRDGDGRDAGRARARVAGGRAGPRRAAVPAARLERQPERRAGAPVAWTRWTAACWPPATSSSTPGP